MVVAVALALQVQVIKAVVIAMRIIQGISSSLLVGVQELPAQVDQVMQVLDIARATDLFL